MLALARPSESRRSHTHGMHDSPLVTTHLVSTYTGTQLHGHVTVLYILIKRFNKRSFLLLLLDYNMFDELNKIVIMHLKNDLIYYYSLDLKNGLLISFLYIKSYLVSQFMQYIYGEFLDIIYTVKVTRILYEDAT